MKRKQTEVESANGAQRQRGRPFGSPGHDAVELGRKGGLTPRSRPLRGSGLTAYADYRMRLVDLQTRERAVRITERQLRTADETVGALIDEADQERATIDRLREQVGELEQRRRELRVQLQTDAGLDELLRQVGESKVESSLARLGWLDDDGGGGDAPAAA